MTGLINLGRASEKTQGEQFNSHQADSAGVKRLEGTIKYRTAWIHIADLAKVADPT